MGEAAAATDSLDNRQAGGLQALQLEPSRQMGGCLLEAGCDVVGGSLTVVGVAILQLDRLKQPCMLGQPAGEGTSAGLFGWHLQAHGASATGMHHICCCCAAAEQVAEAGGALTQVRPTEYEGKDVEGCGVVSCAYSSHMGLEGRVSCVGVLAADSNLKFRHVNTCKPSVPLPIALQPKPSQRLPATTN